MNRNRRAAVVARSRRGSLAEELLGATVAANLRMTERIVGRFVALIDAATPRFGREVAARRVLGAKTVEK
jgi:hypothetical protein